MDDSLLVNRLPLKIHHIWVMPTVIVMLLMMKWCEEDWGSWSWCRTRIRNHLMQIFRIILYHLFYFLSWYLWLEGKHAPIVHIFINNSLILEDINLAQWHSYSSYLFFTISILLRLMVHWLVVETDSISWFRRWEFIVLHHGDGLDWVSSRRWWMAGGIWWFSTDSFSFII